MKKLFFIFTICILSVTGAFCEDNTERTQEYFAKLDNNGIRFLTKLQTCSPAKNLETKEVIYGKTKNGNCHYSFEQKTDGELIQNHCIVPMKVMLGYASTALDVNEYSNGYPDIAKQRFEQNTEIKKIMLDYCKNKVK